MELKTSLENAVAPMQEEARKRISQATDFAERGLEESRNYVRRNPMGMICGALALGTAIGFLLHQRVPTLRERYFDDPLDDIRDLLAKLRDKTGEEVANQYEGAASAVNRAIKKAKKRWF